jgi:hypothetical protein
MRTEHLLLRRAQRARLHPDRHLVELAREAERHAVAGRRRNDSAEGGACSGEIDLNAAQSKPYWPARVVPPKGAPNVLLIMLDDVGFVFSKVATPDICRLRRTTPRSPSASAHHDRHFRPKRAIRSGSLRC